MVDTLALGASAARRGGSSPLSGTKEKRPACWSLFFVYGEDSNGERGRGNGSFPAEEGSPLPYFIC